LPHVGGNWNNGSHAGVFNRNFNNTPSNTNNNNGARAVRLQHNHAQKKFLQEFLVTC
jgi:hypothetical protein